MTDLTPFQSPQPEKGSFEADFSVLRQRSSGPTPLQVAARRRWLILTFALVVMAVVAVGVRQLSPRYTASAFVVVDARQVRVSGGESLLTSQILDLDTLRTRMEALHSQVLARQVVEELDLTNVPEFCMKAAGMIDRLSDLGAKLLPVGWVQPAPAVSGCPSSVADAAKHLTSAISIGNDGRSYTIQISATASSAKLASSIANAYAMAFVDRRRQDIVGLTSQAETWLTGHLADLRAKTVAADTAVQRQRDGSQMTLQRGETVTAQSLAELNTQLTTATSDLQQKRSTLRTLEGSRDSLDASVTAQSSPIVQQLVERESSVAATAADLETRLGSNHPHAKAVAAQLSQIRQQLHAEIGKSVAALRGEVDALDARRAALASAVTNLQQQVSSQGPAGLRLQDLERDAKSARMQYDAAAVRLEQIRADASTQRSDVQMLVEATPPDFPSFPRSNMITAGAFLAALGGGVCLAFVRELMSRVFTTPQEIEQILGLSVLGLFPSPRTRRMKAEDVVVQAPTSPEAEAIHATLDNLLRNDVRNQPGRIPGGRVVMVASSTPGEGKTAFSLALARAAKRRGLSVSIIDCDLRRSRLAKLFPSPERASRTEGDARPQPADMVVDAASGLQLVRVGGELDDPHTIMASRALPRVFDRLRAENDLVILDTSPVLAVSDALNFALMADDVILLAAWRATRRRDVAETLQILQRNYVRISGVVLTKVNLKKLPNTGFSQFQTGHYRAYTSRQAVRSISHASAASASEELFSRS